MLENHELVGKGFRALLPALASYIASELKNSLGSNWWEIGVLKRLTQDQQKGLGSETNEAENIQALDIARCLILFVLHWNEVFCKKLSVDHRIWANELQGVRNRLAHIGSADFSKQETWRALDTMKLLCARLDAGSTKKIYELIRTSGINPSPDQTEDPLVEKYKKFNSERSKLLNQLHTLQNYIVSKLESPADCITVEAQFKRDVDALAALLQTIPRLQDKPSAPVPTKKPVPKPGRLDKENDSAQKVQAKYDRRREKYLERKLKKKVS